jgi:hypothetical protein
MLKIVARFFRERKRRGKRAAVFPAIPEILDAIGFFLEIRPAFSLIFPQFKPDWPRVGMGKANEMKR